MDPTFDGSLRLDGTHETEMFHRMNGNRLNGNFVPGIRLSPLHCLTVWNNEEIWITSSIGDDPYDPSQNLEKWDVETVLRELLALCGELVRNQNQQI